jgi:peptidoglycan hydrolase-like protein with peptidoglycan-binding domain
MAGSGASTDSMARRRIRLESILLIAVVALPGCDRDGAGHPRPPAASAPRSDQLPVDAVTAQLEDALWQPHPPSFVTQSRWQLLRTAYNGRRYQPLWIDSAGLAPRALILARALCAADELGLDSGDYPIAPLTDALEQVRSGNRWVPEALSRLDLLLSSTLVEYSTDLLLGRVGPAGDPNWHLPPRRADSQLVAALAASDLDASLKSFQPDAPGIARLLDLLRDTPDTGARSPWPHRPPDTRLRPGSRSPAVARLRIRLSRSGDLSGNEPTTDSTLYDATVAAAVRRFQRRHGLTADGVVGPGTLALLNLTPVERRGLILANLERYRWLPRSPTAHAVVADVPAGWLHLPGGDSLPLTTAARPDLPPALADSLSALRLIQSNVRGRNYQLLQVGLRQDSSIRLIGAPTSAARHLRDSTAVVAGRDTLIASMLALQPASARSAWTRIQADSDSVALPLNPAIPFYLLAPTIYRDGRRLVVRPNPADGRLIAELSRPESSSGASCRNFEVRAADLARH